jgi:cyclic beta-1,2-glucan synthetase
MRAAELRRLVPDAPQALATLLAATDGAVLPPIRSEIFGPERFAQHGHSLALTHVAERPHTRKATFFPRLRSNIIMLRRAHAYIGAQAATGYDISPAAEWLLDNFHLIEEQLKTVHEGLPRSYFRTLPVLVGEPLAGLPRVYGVAWAFVAHTDSAFDEELLVHFLGAYQASRELSLAEMWALPTTLRVVLVENLRRLAERLAAHKAARELANLCCDHIDHYNPVQLQALHSSLQGRGVAAIFLAQMSQRLQDRVGNPGARASARVLTWLQAALPDAAAVLAQQGADQTADNLSVSNAVNSLRAIGDGDWADIVARTSVVMQLMLKLPLFAAEDTGTRDQTLHGIERLARRSGRSEHAVAQALLHLMHPPDGAAADTAAATDLPACGLNAAQQNPTQPGTARHWLSGPGRPRLALQLGLHDGAWRAKVWAARHLVLPAYITTMLAATLLLVAHVAGGAAPGWHWLAALLMLGPASETVVALVNRLISESVPPQHLPRLALAAGIPPEHRVLVVVPAFLGTPQNHAALLHRLRLHQLANPEPNAQFALLTDWPDAATEVLDTDAERLADMLQQLQALNAGASPPALDAQPPAAVLQRFILLHRPRRYSHSEQAWIGWERKRGKLEQLIAVLAEGAGAGSNNNSSNNNSNTLEANRSSTGINGAFLDLGLASRLAPCTPYVLTLDADTHLPPGRLRDLVGVAAHPHNTPRVCAQGRRVVAGYGILQPRMATPLPMAGQGTRFHALFAGQCGIDPYSAATSEVYQDLFGEGSFNGKGLLNVVALHTVLAGRLPQDQVLSHDLLEGSIARCAAVTDTTLIEDAPGHADVAAARLHRWTRGDWQLLPLLLQPRRYPMAAINRWKMLDNLRRSLVAPLALATAVMALMGLAGPPGPVLALVLGAFAAGPLMGAVAGLAPSRDNIAKRHFYAQAGSDLLRALLSGLWHGALLLQHALQNSDAVLRALLRTFVTHRRLLEWTTAEASQAAASTQLRTLLRQHRATPLWAAVLWLALLTWMLSTGTPNQLWASAVCLLWALAPVWTWWVSRARPVCEGSPLQGADRTYLLAVARDTWRYFERCVTAADNHLPPDNLQTAPHDMLAHRTSPTNIGLYLLSVACAHRLGWVGIDELLLRLQSTLASVDRLERHRGHLLNWYDTQTLLPLLPRYVSTVDSGNFSGHVLTLAQACAEWAAQPQAPTHQAQLLALATRCEQLAWQADFGFLYHRKRQLLHIGYRVAEQQLDAGFYDLLASESRLTSLLAIAKGDVPVRHWAALGRPFFAVGTVAGLRSWSGSMFEYLMPTLVLDEPQGSVLQGAGVAALQEQVAYGQAQRVPWGISESAYAGCDHTLAYQYAPQGVPRLALRRTPPAELVVAPYASALAAQLEPHRATINLLALQKLGARVDASSHQSLGFIDALDYTPALQTAGDRYTPVRTYMAHHQGMTLVALTNVLQGGVVQRWGMASAHVQAVASLLHERAPREVSRLFEPPSGPRAQPLLKRSPALLRHVRPGQQAVEPTQLLSNGRYSVALRANGAGSSSLTGAYGLADARSVTRHIHRVRDDALRDACGSFFYLRRQAGAPLVSITQHPAPDAAARYRSVFHADRVCFDAAWPDLQAHITAWVSPEDDIEFRQVELSNLGTEAIEIELISAFEVTLAEAKADESHPAFSSLFVGAQWQPAQQALVFERRPRLATEVGLHMAHFLALGEPQEAQVLGLQGQTDRARWLGRNRASSEPLADLHTLARSGEAQVLNTGLDPACVLAVRVRIAPQTKALLTFATAASADAQTLRALVDKYRQASSSSSNVQRASLMSATLAGIRLRGLRISADNLAAVQMLTTALVQGLHRMPYGGTTPPAGATEPQACDRRLLWRLGISGDRPLLLVSAGALHGMGLLRTLAQALRLWAWGGISCDLVVVNAEPASYLMALHREIGALRDRHLADNAHAAIGFHLLRADDLNAAELTTLQALARVRLVADGRALLHHVNAWVALHETARALQAAQPKAALLAAASSPAHPTQGSDNTAESKLQKTEMEGSAEMQGSEMQGSGLSSIRHTRDLTPYFSDFLTTDSSPDSLATLASQLPAPASPAHPSGHFAARDGAFSFAAGLAQRPQRPWINVLANPGFGTQVSEAGGGCTWAVNSRLHQLTAWSNDPVADPPSEWLLLQDRRSLATWSATPSAWAAPGVDYAVSHNAGTTTISHTQGDLQIELQWCVDLEAPVKQLRLRLHNSGRRTLELRAVAVAEWLMGQSRSDRHTLHSAVHRQPLPGAELTALLCTQCEATGGFGNSTAWLATGLPTDTDTTVASGVDWTCDRREFFDNRGQPVLPHRLGQTQGSGLDPCAALAMQIDLAPGQRAERVFLLGHAASPDAARLDAAHAARISPHLRSSAVRTHWQALLGATTVATPDPLFDALVNHWLLYQAVSCRLWAKAGFYQAGGATGFRDQLQDTLALAWAAPHLLRQQILRCAARQFEAGDVQHWWHEPTGAGVRTHFSDDLLWLPHALLHYLHTSADQGLLDETLPFLQSAAIPEGAEDLYDTPTAGVSTASVYEHAARTLDHSLRVGVHGLPLMGSGDWNDGMNRVGVEGRGESVWLAWFALPLVAGMAALAQARGEGARAQKWQDAAASWRAALAGPAWDGQWYTRAFFDNGQPLGTNTAHEARIDLIAQAWAVLSGAAPVGRQQQAMASARAELADPANGLLRLLHPPLQNAQPSAGYIQAYPPGVRENGGQYTHGGVWALMAQAQLQADGHAPPSDLPYEWFTWLSPAHRAANPVWGGAYGIEPYAVAGDVSAAPPHAGRGGWSWYTGAAAWLHRAAVESIFGLRLGATTLSLHPCLPAHWPRAEITLRRDGRVMQFVLLREGAAQLGTLPPGARTLRGGEAVAWTTLPAHNCFLLWLPAVQQPVQPAPP